MKTLLKSACFAMLLLCWSAGADGTELTWDSVYVTGLEASFTITPDLVFTSYGQTIQVPASGYVFMLGDYWHAPTQGVITTLNPDYGTSIALSLGGGWTPDSTVWDWVWVEPYIVLTGGDFPSGFVEKNHQSETAILHMYGQSMFYTSCPDAVSHPCSQSVPWGDHALTLPYMGTYRAYDFGHWDNTGITIPLKPQKPTGPLPIPDPGSTMLLFGIGLVGLGAWRRRWR
jgi:hypothetical protein